MFERGKVANQQGYRVNIEQVRNIVSVLGSMKIDEEGIETNKNRFQVLNVFFKERRESITNDFLEAYSDVLEKWKYIENAYELEDAQSLTTFFQEFKEKVTRLSEFVEAYKTSGGNIGNLSVIDTSKRKAA